MELSFGLVAVAETDKVEISEDPGNGTWGWDRPDNREPTPKLEYVAFLTCRKFEALREWYSRIGILRATAVGREVTSRLSVPMHSVSIELADRSRRGVDVAMLDEKEMRTMSCYISTLSQSSGLIELTDIHG